MRRRELGGPQKDRNPLWVSAECLTRGWGGGWSGHLCSGLQRQRGGDTHSGQRALAAHQVRVTHQSHTRNEAQESIANRPISYIIYSTPPLLPTLFLETAIAVITHAVCMCPVLGRVRYSNMRVITESLLYLRSLLQHGGAGGQRHEQHEVPDERLPADRHPGRR